MSIVRFVLSTRTSNFLKAKRVAAEKNGDLRLFKKITGILAVSDQFTFIEVARLLEVTAESVRVWVRDFIQMGIKSLTGEKSKGRPSKITKKQKGELDQIIQAGPAAAGYPGQCWRSPMIQDIIKSNFGVIYSVFYIAELLKNMGFSFQKAQFESGHLNELARNMWRWKTWPEILQKAKRIGAHILFGDEASFPQWGTLNYTWAKIGHTPTIKTSGNRRGYKVLGLIDYITGKFYSQAQEGKLESQTYIAFLEAVMDKVKGHLIIVQDGSSYHTSVETKEFFADNSDRLTVAQLPPYSPDYNPIEKLWKKIKQHGTHLQYFPTFESLKDKVDLMLDIFANECKEVLALCGFYREPTEQIA